MPHLVKIPEASRITGIPVSTIRKSFMRNPPKNTPPAPPHKRIGRAVYIVADRLEAWVNALPTVEAPKKRGRPTKAEQIARRAAGRPDCPP